MDEMDRATELHQMIGKCYAELRNLVEESKKEKVEKYKNRYYRQQVDGNDFHYDGGEYQDRYEYRKYLGCGNNDRDYSCFFFREFDANGSCLVETNYLNNNDPEYLEEISAEDFYSAWHKLLKELSEISL
jgi:hypothetical protein